MATPVAFQGLAPAVAPPGESIIMFDDGFGFPEDRQWTVEDVRAADAEGWGLFDADGSENGRTQLQRCDDAGLFPSDDEAWAYVAERARNGSDRHLRALRLVRIYNLTEAEAFERATGFQIP